jgi:SAM-dependent methyltransferase
MTKIVPTYEGKGGNYFGGARKLFVDLLPPNPAARLLEIGCGNGDTSAYARSTGKCGWCCGVELCEGPAAEARAKLDQVLVGDVEKVLLPATNGGFDVLILSEVLEHLIDPWKALARLRPLMNPGAIVLSGSPNVCYYGVLFTLIKGRWRYEDKGVFDATHLRWFSPATYRELFESAGFEVDFVRAADPIGKKGWLGNVLTLGRMPYLFHEQIFLKGRCLKREA